MSELFAISHRRPKPLFTKRLQRETEEGPKRAFVFLRPAQREASALSGQHSAKQAKMDAVLLQQHLFNLYANRSLTDVVIRVKDGQGSGADNPGNDSSAASPSFFATIHAHKVILAQSGFFRALMTTSFRDGSSSSEPLDFAIDNSESPELQPSIIRALVEHLYGAEAPVDGDNAPGLLFASSFFDVPSLTQKVADFVFGHLSKDNAVRFALLTEGVELGEAGKLISDASHAFILRLSDSIDPADLASLPLSRQQTMLTSSDLYIASEFDRFTLAINIRRRVLQRIQIEMAEALELRRKRELAVTRLLIERERAKLMRQQHLRMAKALTLNSRHFAGSSQNQRKSVKQEANDPALALLAGNSVVSSANPNAALLRANNIAIMLASSSSLSGAAANTASAAAPMQQQRRAPPPSPLHVMAADQHHRRRQDEAVATVNSHEGEDKNAEDEWSLDSSAGSLDLGLARYHEREREKQDAHGGVGNGGEQREGQGGRPPRAPPSSASASFTRRLQPTPTASAHGAGSASNGFAPSSRVIAPVSPVAAGMRAFFMMRAAAAAAAAAAMTPTGASGTVSSPSAMGSGVAPFARSRYALHSSAPPPPTPATPPPTARPDTDADTDAETPSSSLNAAVMDADDNASVASARSFATCASAAAALQPQPSSSSSSNHGSSSAVGVGTTVRSLIASALLPLGTSTAASLGSSSSSSSQAAGALASPEQGQAWSSSFLGEDAEGSGLADVVGTRDSAASGGPEQDEQREAVEAGAASDADKDAGADADEDAVDIDALCPPLPPMPDFDAELNEVVQVYEEVFKSFRLVHFTEEQLKSALETAAVEWSCQQTLVLLIQQGLKDRQAMHRVLRLANCYNCRKISELKALAPMAGNAESSSNSSNSSNGGGAGGGDGSSGGGSSAAVPAIGAGAAEGGATSVDTDAALQDPLLDDIALVRDVSWPAFRFGVEVHGVFTSSTTNGITHSNAGGAYVPLGEGDEPVSMSSTKIYFAGSCWSLDVKRYFSPPSPALAPNSNGAAGGEFVAVYLRRKPLAGTPFSSAFEDSRDRTAVAFSIRLCGAPGSVTSNSIAGRSVAGKSFGVREESSWGWESFLSASNITDPSSWENDTLRFVINLDLL